MESTTYSTTIYHLGSLKSSALLMFHINNSFTGCDHVSIYWLGRHAWERFSDVTEVFLSEQPDILSEANLAVLQLMVILMYSKTCIESE